MVKITIKICTRNNKKSVTKLCKLYKTILDCLRDSEWDLVGYLGDWIRLNGIVKKDTIKGM